MWTHPDPEIHYTNTRCITEHIVIFSPSFVPYTKLATIAIQKSKKRPKKPVDAYIRGFHFGVRSFRWSVGCIQEGGD